MRAGLLLLACLALAARAEPPTEAAGQVVVVSGSVHVEAAAQSQRLVRAGDAIHEGESIVTGGDGEVHMEMADGGTIAVRPNTRLRLAEYRARGDDQDRSVFDLLAGGFRSITGWIGRFNPRSYRIRTPTATIGVRGTDHEPQVIPEGSAEGEPGTYDKVNAGATYVETAEGVLEVPEQRAAFVPLALTGSPPRPRLLEALPRFYRPGIHEHLLERRHETVQHLLEQRRLERRQFLQRPLLRDRPPDPRALRPERLQAREAPRPERLREHRPPLRPGEGRPRASGGRPGVPGNR